MLKIFCLFTMFVLLIAGCGGRRKQHLTTNGGEGNNVENEFPSPISSEEQPQESDDLPKPRLCEIKLALPLNNISITSPFGIREDPITGKKKEHHGLDLSASNDYPVAMMRGEVLSASFNNVAGNFVTLKHGELTISYCHLSKIFVKQGQNVEAGTIIGITGDTGRASGEHLHLTCKFCDKIIDPAILIDIIMSQTTGDKLDSYINIVDVN